MKASTYRVPTVEAKRLEFAGRREAFLADVRRLRWRVRQLWIASLVSGIAFAAALLARMSFDFSESLFWLIVATSLFAATVCTRLRVTSECELDLAEQLVDINAREIARLDRDWQQLPIPDVVPPEDFAASSRDLDLFGEASLCHLICHARTPWGLARVADWIAVPADPEALSSRQQTVQELAPSLDYRQRLEAAASFVEGLGERSTRFVNWMTDQRDERWLVPATWIARVLTALAVIAIGWSAFAEKTWVGAGFVLTGIVLTNVVFSIVCLGRVHTMFAIVAEGADDVIRYRRLIDAAAEFTPVTPELVRLHETVAQARRGIRLLEQLTWLSKFQNLRFALLFFVSIPLFFIFLLYAILQFVLLWDFHVAWGLSIWRRRFGAAVTEAFEAVGQIEAIASLAAVADAHPDWSFAHIRTDGIRVLEAKRIGHPLLRPAACVRNDLSIGPTGTALLVTGSNMSGKSTLLRAVGTNVVLAQAGGPVCAEMLLMPPLQIATVMRVTDSLEAGISLFMAELLAIRRVVDLADRLDGEVDRVLLYLLDEILLGTNNAERRMAAVGIIAHLMQRNAIGAVSTHDLDLVTHPAIAQGCRPVYFRESFVSDGAEPRMTFDYLMHPGIAPTTNVAYLLKAVGLPSAGSSWNANQPGQC